MKRIICFICALLCALTLFGCNKNDGEVSTTESATATEAIEAVKVDLTDEMIQAIKGWRDVSSWNITFSSMATFTDDGDTENTNGYFVGFDGSMIPGEKGNMYHANTLVMNSYYAFQLQYEMYYYDGWAYQIYKDASVEELNTYERYETTEAYFCADYEGIVPIIATDTELSGGEASQSGDIVTVSVSLGDGRARDELIGDIDAIANNNGVAVEDIAIESAVVTYAIENNKLTGFVGTVKMVFDVDGVTREYEIEKSAVINKTGDEVEAFTLPEDIDNYEILEWGSGE